MTSTCDSSQSPRYDHEQRRLSDYGLQQATWSGVIGGSGTLVKSGNGDVNLTGANTSRVARQ